MRDRLTVQQPPDQPHRLVQAVEPFAEPAPKVDAEGFMLALEPAAADAQDGATVAQVIKGRREFRGHARWPERVGRHEQAQSNAVGQDCEGRERGPALQLPVGRIALVGQQVIVDPDRVPTGILHGQAGITKGRPGRAIDPERGPETHGVRMVVRCARERPGVAPRAAPARLICYRIGWFD